jgi:hypothetical protein
VIVNFSKKELARIAEQLLDMDENSLTPKEVEALVPYPVGPWFQGWYTRITDPMNDLSIAVVGESQYLPDQTLSDDGSLPGYLVVIIRDKVDGGRVRTEVDDAFPERTIF